MRKETILALIGLILFAYGAFSLYSSIKLCAVGFCSVVKISIPLVSFTVGVVFSIWAITVAAKRIKAERAEKKARENL